MKQIFPALLFALTACCSLSYGQDNSTSKSIISRFTAFSENHPTEKAYLHFDKPCYAAGDTVYFKAYVTAGEQHKLSRISGVLHADLINASNKIDQSIILKLDSGITWGDFALPDSLPAGNYRIRAYTQWMRNDGEKDFFEKAIPVGAVKSAHIAESLVKQPEQVKLRADVQFFPEGGSMIVGTRSKIAFKAIGPEGLGIDVKGAVFDDDNNQLATFTAAHLGMGYFYLVPGAAKTYTAKVSFPDGQQAVFSLPKAEPSGINLMVDNDSIPKATVKIEADSAYYRDNKNKLYTLVIYSGGIVTTVNCNLNNPVIKLDILKRKLHTGVATVTLFSPQNEPLCERLLFIQNYDELSLQIKSDKYSYAKREGVNVKLNALNRKGDPAEGHFSVSVVDETLVPTDENNGNNIVSDLLLTSDLKGYVEQPNYYFADTSAAARKNLDILMLTQGYRRFTWPKVMASTNGTPTYLPEKGITIAGQVTNLLNKPVANGTITLLPAKGGPLLSATTDDKGMFRFTNLVFTDTTRFVLSAVNSKNRNTTKITFFNGEKYAPAIQGNMLWQQPQLTNAAMTAFVENDKHQQAELLNSGIVSGKMLKEVKIKAAPIDDKYRTQSLAGAGNADQVMHADEIEKIGGQLSTSLNGRLHGIVFYGGIPYLNTSLNQFRGAQPMLLIIDGEPQQPIHPPGVDIVNSNNVETVEVLRYASTSIYGAAGGNGVLIITTKQGGGIEAKDITSVGVLPITPKGFYKAREFYSPTYSPGITGGKQPDLRSTIFWKPEIKTDKDGNASFDFYNADGTGVYKITVEGIDKNGNIGRQIYRYKVE